MAAIGKIKVKNLSDLKDTQTTQQEAVELKVEFVGEINTPVSKPKCANKSNKGRRAAATTSKKTKLKEDQNENKIPKNKESTTIKNIKSGRKTKTGLSPNQLRIDTFFKACNKTDQIEADKKQLTNAQKTTKHNANVKIGDKIKSTKKNKRRKCLFKDDQMESSTSMSGITNISTKLEYKPNLRRKRKCVENASKRCTKPVEYVDLCTDSEQELEVPGCLTNAKENAPNSLLESTLKEELSTSVAEANQATSGKNICTAQRSQDEETQSETQSLNVVATKTFDSPAYTRSCLSEVNKPTTVYAGSVRPENSTSSNISKPGTTRRRKPRALPPYKVIAGTPFAVDAFQYTPIEGVTHYFLTHFHADHYTGLNRKFSMPLFVSPITARLVRTFIPIDEQFLHEIKTNETLKIEDVEVTAIDANHCPGAIMLLFKLPCGKCILHTGDFRASADMESLPVFWNHQIHTIYLDTTYLSDKYAFQSQCESIDSGRQLLEDFQKKHPSERILYICSSYVIGKEKFWSALACKFRLKVWMEGNRLQALKAMKITKLENLLCDDPYKANMHVLGIGTNYEALVSYLKDFSNYFDTLLAIRPSGWEKNSRPRFQGKINIVGIEYSEHSSYSELERFVRFLRPQEVISTVPIGRDPLLCGKVPQKWYKYGEAIKGVTRNFQTSITTYMKLNGNARQDSNAKTHAEALPRIKSDSKLLGLVSPWKSTAGTAGFSPSLGELAVNAEERCLQWLYESPSSFHVAEEWEDD